MCQFRFRVACVWTVAFLSSLSPLWCATTTIAVAGYNSVQNRKPGIFDTAALIDPLATKISLPGAIPTASAYLAVEQDVYERVVLAHQLHHEITLLGHSHGATLTLRVIARLYTTHPSLVSRIRLVTLDRIAVGYPLETAGTDTLPPGLQAALNIYQTADSDSHLRGAALGGATNVNVTSTLLFERSTGATTNPTDQRFGLPFHNYI